MFSVSTLIDEFISYLNSLLRIDPELVQKLIEHKEECNEEFRRTSDTLVINNSLNVLNLVNSFLGIDTLTFTGPIRPKYDNNGKLVSFHRDPTF